MKKFDVMFSSDSKYIDIMLASIYSFLLNSNFDNIRIHIITSGFSKEDYKKIEDFIAMFPNTEIYFYPMEGFDIERYKLPSWRGVQISNARLFFEEIIKPQILGIENMLYLDSDTITVSDLTDLENYSDGLYAVKDSCMNEYVTSLPNLPTYYNSGVIYINVNEWINGGYQDRIVDFLENNSNIELRLPDQDTLNCALTDQFKQLPLKYNIPPTVYAFNNTFRKIYFNPNRRNISYEQVVEAIQDPKIFHGYGFGGFKPWQGKFNPYSEEFMKYILSVNPDFKSDKLDCIQTAIAKFPYLYRAIILMMTYMPQSLEQRIKKIAFTLKNN